MGRASADQSTSEMRAARKLISRVRRGESVDWGEAEADCPNFLARSAVHLRRAQSVVERPSMFRLPDEAEPGERPNDQATMELLARELPGYEPLVSLGEGGQGMVYEAIQLSTKRRVAIKVLAEGPFATSRQLSRFTREIELVARLRHPNIVTVHESGVVCGRPYLVMELVEGLPVEDYALFHGLGAREVVGIFERVCDAVTHAHQRGVIHRDIKPSNVLVDESGEPRILDFGLAKDIEGPRSGCTLTGQIIGTLHYASPEQALGKGAEADVRTDVYALGLILFKAITGFFPYRVMGTTKEIIDAIAEDEPRKLRTTIMDEVEPESRRLEGINADLERVVRKALEKDPRRRYQSVAALADDLRRYLAGDPVEAGVGVNAYLLRKTVRRFRVHIGIAAVFVLVLIGSLVMVTRAWRQTAEVARIAQTGLQMGSLVRTGQVRRDEGRLDDAIEMLLRAADLGMRVPQTHRDVRIQIFETQYMLADLYLKKGDIENAQRHRAIASQLARRLFDEEPDNPEVLRKVAFSSDLAGRELARVGQQESALAEFANAEVILRDLLAASTDTERREYDLALLLFRKGRCQSRLGRTSSAFDTYVEAAQRLERLVALDPGKPEYALELARIEAETAVGHLMLKVPASNLIAARLLDQADARLVRLAEADNAKALRNEIQGLRDAIKGNRELVSKRLAASQP